MKKLKGIAKRIAAAGLAAILFISQAGMSVLAEELTEVPELTGVSDTMSFADLQTLINDAGNDDTITLEKDVNWTEGDSNSLEISSGKNVTLDLNDHYILYKGTANAPVITVNGSLTLKDSKTPKTTRYVTLADGRATGVSESNTSGAIEVTGGFIAGGNHENNNGGGVYVHNSCMFTMEGGTIVGCKAYYGGGVYVNNSGTFTMNGGSITDCTANNSGGVFVNNSGNFNMNGGSITNCTATNSGDKQGGGGVYVSSSGKFNMEGGSITDCTATSQGGGVYVYGGTFNVIGAPVIRDNKKGSDANNVAFYGSKTITVTGALTDGAEIRVSGAKGNVIAKPGNPSGSTTAYTITDIDAARFHSDLGNFIGGVSGGNVVFKEEVYISGISAQNKEYDGNKTATVTGTAILKRINGNAAVDGLTVSDITAEFENKNAGDDKTVTITSGTLSDTDNYILVPGATSGLKANITPASVTITGISAKDKTYDTTTEATVTGTPVITGKIGNDDVTVSVGTATFDNANAGNNKTVTFSGFGLSGTDSGNYALSAQLANVTANITKGTPTILTTPTVDPITYGQALSAVGNTFNGGVAKINGTDVSGSYEWTDGTVTPSVSDSNSTEYEVRFTPTDISNLNTTTCKVKLTVNKAKAVPATVTADDRTYDGTSKPLVIVTGTATGGDMQYTLGENGSTAPTSGWSGSIPTAKNAGTYCVWYKVKEDENHNDAGDGKLEVTIAKADSPAEITVSKNYLYTKGGQDSLRLGVLPEDCGNVTWKEPTVSGNLSFTAGPAISDPGVLSYTVGSGTAGTSGSVKIIAETQNYNDITINVNIRLSDKISLKLKEGTAIISAGSFLTYGDKLSALSFGDAEFISGNENEPAAEGTLVWKAPDVVPDAGKISAEWIFTPDNPVYYNCEGTVDVTVNKAPINPAVTIAGWIYGGEASEPEISGNPGNGAVVYYYSKKGEDDYSEKVPVNAGKYTVKAVVSETANYLGKTVTADFEIGKASPVYEAPVAIPGLVYDGKEHELVQAGSVTTGSEMEYALTPDGTYSAELPKGKDAGEYTVYFRLMETADVNGLEPSPVKVTIAAKPVTVKADDKEKDEGAEDPEFTVTVAGLAEGEDESLIRYGFTREEGESAGEYAITPFGDAAQGNYSVTYENGVLTVRERKDSSSSSSSDECKDSSTSSSSQEGKDSSSSSTAGETGKDDSSSSASDGGSEKSDSSSSSAAGGEGGENKDSGSSSTTKTQEKSEPVKVSVGGQELSVAVSVEHVSETVYTGEKLTAEDLGVKADTGELVELAKTALAKTEGSSADISDSDLSSLFITSYKIGGKGETGEATVTAKIKFDKKQARSLGMSKEDIKAMTKAVAALNKALKKTPAKVKVAKADLAKCFEKLEASFNSKGKLKIRSLTINVDGKSHNLKKKDVTIIDTDPEKGLVTLEGTGKNVEGKITVDVNTGKRP